MGAPNITTIAYGSDAWHAAVALRLDVLRKPLGLQFTTAQLEAERDAFHYAAYVRSDPPRMVATAFLMPLDGTRIQLRQMAVVAELRGTGIGRALLRHMEHDAAARGFGEIVADARVSALPFYRALDYTAHGDVYEHVGLPHRKISKRI